MARNSSVHNQLHRYRLQFSIGTIKRNDFTNRLLFADPRKITVMLIPSVLGKSNRRMSGHVTSKPLFKNATIPLNLVQKIRYCLAHWEFGLSWEKSGALDYYSKFWKFGSNIDKVRDYESFIERTRRLDLIFDQVSNEGKLRTRFELGMTNSPIDERGGIYVHVNEKGELIFGGGGYHRLAIAKILGLEQIPVCIGIVHREYQDELNGILAEY